MTKAEEILEKHLKINDVETMLGKHGRTHNAVINALNEAINYTRCCTELPIKEDDTEYWVDLVNWESGGIEEVSNNNLLEFKKDIDVEIQRRLKK